MKNETNYYNNINNFFNGKIYLKRLSDLEKSRLLSIAVDTHIFSDSFKSMAIKSQLILVSESSGYSMATLEKTVKNIPGSTIEEYKKINR